MIIFGQSDWSVNYRTQTKFAKVMFSQVSVCPQAGGSLSGRPPRTVKCGRYASYWNAFLLEMFHVLKNCFPQYIPVLMNITFPQVRLRAVIKVCSHLISMSNLARLTVHCANSSANAEVWIKGSFTLGINVCVCMFENNRSNGNKTQT